MASKSILYLVYLTFFLLPWYYLRSGSAQPVDVAVIMLFAVLFFVRQLIFTPLLKLSGIYIFLLSLLIYTMLCFMLNYILFGQIETLQLLLQTIYFILMINVIVSAFINIYLNHTKQDFYKIVLNCLLLSTVIPVMFYFVSQHNDLNRTVLSFINPNQLAIYALLEMSILFYITLFARECNLKVNKLASLCLINLYLLFFLVSVSRAAFPIVLLYLVSYFIIFKVKQFRQHTVAWILIILLLILLPTWLLFNDILLHFESVREANAFNMSALQDEINIRMLDGISYNFSSLFYFLFGVGQTSNPLRPQHLEFHNNFMGIFNQVGIIGFVLYLILNISILRLLFKLGILYILPYACYLEMSCFHYLFRERINWCFFAVLILMTIYKKLDVVKAEQSQEAISEMVGEVR